MNEHEMSDWLDDDDALDRLLSDAKPDVSEKATARLQSHWDGVLTTRRNRRRWVAWGAMATAAAVLIALGWMRRQHAGSLEGELAEAIPEVIESPDTESVVSPGQDTTDQVIPDPIPEEPKEIEKTVTQQFIAWLEEKPAQHSQQWAEHVVTLRRLSPTEQLEVIDSVGKLEAEQIRSLGAMLILDAAAGDAPLVLSRWMDVESMRPFAWNALVLRSNQGNWHQLVAMPSDTDEKAMLCQHMASLWNQGGLNALVELAQRRPWRSGVQRAAKFLPAQSYLSLIDAIDQRDNARRIGAAFVLGSLPTDLIDQQLAGMIVQGRRRIAAYQALMVRNTDGAQRFLALSAQRYDLSPALAAARRRWVQWGPQTTRWLAETRSFENENDNATAGSVHSAFAAVSSKDPSTGEPS